MYHNPKIGGIVLCGGKSKRMGIDKGLIRINNAYLIEYVIKSIKPCCDKIYLSVNNTAYSFLGFETIADEHQNSGPMAGLLSGLRRSEYHLNFIVSCDIPYLSQEVVKYIISKAEPDKISYPAYDGFKEPLCAVYPKSIAAELEKMIAGNNLKVAALLDNFPSKEIDISEMKGFDKSVFTNVNTKEELIRFQAYVQRH